MRPGATAPETRTAAGFWAAGYEYAFTNNWTEIEYDYINLRHRTFTLEPAILVGPGGPHSVTLCSKRVRALRRIPWSETSLRNVSFPTRNRQISCRLVDSIRRRNKLVSLSEG